MIKHTHYTKYTGWFHQACSLSIYDLYGIIILLVYIVHDGSPI